MRTRERQAELVARGANRTMNSRHLTRHAVDLVALDGEVSWQWENYFRVAGAMQAAAQASIAKTTQSVASGQGLLQAPRHRGEG
jgi:hypothetical protein